MVAIGGWKTKVGALFIGLAAAITAVGYPEIGDQLRMLGEAVLGLGIAHKITKLGGN